MQTRIGEVIESTSTSFTSGASELLEACTSTDGSLTLPRLEYWHYRDGRGWHDELSEERTALHAGDPYAEQLRHFRAVIEGKEEPVCSADDAMRSLEATLAVGEAGATGREVTLSEPALRR